MQGRTLSPVIERMLSMHKAPESPAQSGGRGVAQDADVG